MEAVKTCGSWPKKGASSTLYLQQRLATGQQHLDNTAGTAMVLRLAPRRTPSGMMLA
jgi:hypothetical protein